ncbi:MAG TPA: response regulator transcription factor [Candidatus Acidoferrum sp.]|jgi:DNA-binding NarL/FixJ family response regulator
MASELRILLADDHPAMRVLLRDIVETIPDWQVCGEARDGEEAIASARALLPDVIVMDLMMPRRNGLEAAREITAFAPGTRVLITTLYDFRGLVDEAKKVGARGCFLKSESHQHLVPAVEATANRDNFYAERG